MFRVLNVGGSSKEIPIPALYDGWEHLLLDIDPRGKPDIVADARDMSKIKEKFDSIYCSHNLEHFHPHEVIKVLKQFKKVLDKDGFVFIRVPDLEECINQVQTRKLSWEDPIYQSSEGGISGLDMIYGHHREIERSGQEWFSHKIGFSADLLRKYLTNAGFKYVFIKKENFELVAIASNKLKDNPFEE